MATRLCGVIRNGVPCEARIVVGREACLECCDLLLAELERMADLPEMRLLPRAVVNRVETVCKCGNDIDRPGQAMCKACHRKYMKDWRARHVYVALPKGLTR